MFGAVIVDVAKPCELLATFGTAVLPAEPERSLNSVSTRYAQGTASSHLVRIRSAAPSNVSVIHGPSHSRRRACSAAKSSVCITHCSSGRCDWAAASIH